jgi:hypothetical protein
VSTRALLAGLLFVGSVGGTHAELVPCRQPSDARRIVEALSRLRQTVDPCGESAEVTAVLDALADCRTARYEICVSADTDRNLFDRPTARDGVRTIVWNPELRSALEPRCEEQGPSVHREPTASLLHELVHAAHDCAGLDPGQLELDAVRIENIYRRAAGLPQRAGYGVEMLPASVRRTCAPDGCPCSVPSQRADTDVPRVEAAIRRGPVADGGHPVR